MAAAADLVTTDLGDRRAEPARTLVGPVPRPLWHGRPAGPVGESGRQSPRPRRRTVRTRTRWHCPPVARRRLRCGGRRNRSRRAAGLRVSAGGRSDRGTRVGFAARPVWGTRVLLPTVLNLLQCLGWAVFELVVIAAAAEQLFPGHASMRRPTLATSAGPMSLSPAWTMSHNACKRSVRNREP
jgi:hypothetical protein